jgi:hypothetical protein
MKVSEEECRRYIMDEKEAEKMKFVDIIDEYEQSLFLPRGPIWRKVHHRRHDPRSAASI